MSWAKDYIQRLKNGETVKFRPRGNSMSGIVESGQLVTVEPILSSPNVGDVVLCKVGGNQYLHKVTAVRSNGQFEISNNRGHANGWININAIYGKLIGIEK